MPEPYEIPEKARKAIEAAEERKREARAAGTEAAQRRKGYHDPSEPRATEGDDKPRPSVPQAHARRGDPATSRRAATSVTGIRLSQAAVLKLFKDSGAMTDAELVERYPIFRRVAGVTAPRQSESGLRTRRKELVDVGKLRDTGVKKRLPSGRMAIVWGT